MNYHYTMMKVRELIKEIEKAGWEFKRMRGSHRVYQHPEKTNTLVIPGNLGKDVKKGLCMKLLKDAGVKHGE